MARKFLTPIDLNKLELQNAAVQNLSTPPGTPSTGQIYYDTSGSPYTVKIYNGTSWVQVGGSTEEEIEDIVDGLIVAGTGIGKNYDDNGNTLTISNTGVTSITGTANEVDVSASTGSVTISLPASINADTTGNAATATKWASPITITLGSDLSGTASIDGSSNVTLNATIAANSVALGTDTTGDYVASITSSGSGISVSGTGEGAAVTISNTGVTSLAGTANQVSVSASVGAVTLSLPQDIHSGSSPTFAGVTSGNIQVGVTTDNEIDTSSGNLTIDSSGGTVTIDDNLVITGSLTVSGSATYVNTEIVTIDDNIVLLNSNSSGSPTQDAGIEVERGDSTNVSILWNETNDNWTLTNDGSNYHEIVRRYATNVGNSASTVFTITHNLGTRDVVVQVYDNATYETVEVDVARTSTTVVTLTFATAPSSNAYRVVITG